MEFKNTDDGEWCNPDPKGFSVRCCDCGLVHRVDFRIVWRQRGGRRVRRVQFRVFRDQPETKLQRKRETFKCRASVT